MIKCKNCGHEFDDTKVPEVGMGAIKCPDCGATLDQEGNVAKSIDSMRNLAGELSRKLNPADKERLSASPPIKDKVSEMSESTPQITGIKNQKTSGIPGDKARSQDAISGNGEAGSKTPIA